MSLSHAQRIELGLDDPPPGYERPAASQANEFAPPPPGSTPARVQNLRLVLKDGEKASAPKIRQMVNELLAGNMDNANYALQQLFAANPKLALETYIELAKFALPQLKAVAVAIDDRSDNPRSFSFAELQKVLSADP